MKPFHLRAMNSKERRKLMKIRLLERFLFVSALLFSILLFSVNMSFAQAPVKLRIAGQPLGGSMFVIAAGIGEVLKTVLPKGSTVDILPYAGSAGNPKLVGEGGAEIGLAVNFTNKWAYEGRIAYDKKYENLRALVGGYDTGWLCIMNHPKVQLNSFDEIKEKKFPIKIMILTAGSLGAFGAKQMLDAYGISANDIKSWGGSITETSFPTIVSAFQDGRIDSFIHIPTPGNPTVTELSLSPGIKFLPIKDEVRKRMAVDGWIPNVMPAGTWKGQDKDIASVGWWTSVICTKDMSEDIAYLVTKTLIERKGDVASFFAGFNQLDPKTAWTDEKNGIPLHPGAIRYFKEKKLMP
jgi:uncharacterized protein